MMSVSQSNHFLAGKGFELQDSVVWACNGVGLKNMLQAGRQWLELHKHLVNGLNVFPVPDGDTGTNMVLTMQSAVEQLEVVSDCYKVETIAAAAAHGALMGARGNSGVILSQFLQGLALGMEGKATFTTKEFASAAELGAKQAYQSVIDPVEGTILTVARAASEAAQQHAQTEQDLVLFISHIVEAVKVAQANTPELLPILKEAGVTDAGGQGLLFMLEGGLRFLQNKPLDLVAASDVIPTLRPTLDIGENSYGYDVQFLIEGEQLDVEKIRLHIDTMGWSTLVVGDEHTVKVHVHVEDPDQPLSYGADLGTIRDVVVEDMGKQAKAFVHEYAAPPSPSTPAKLGSRKPITDIATVSIVAGKGLTDIFISLGADRILPGGQSMNPSTQELLEAIGQIETDKVLILPNNRNIILSARQAVKLSQKAVRVVPTHTIPQGIAALLSFNNQVDLETNARRMLDAAQQVRTLEITQAVRETTLNGFKIKPGDLMGLLDNQLISVGQNCIDVALAGLSQLENSEYELITIYYGQAGSRERADALARRINALYADIRVEVHQGDQPYYHYIISVE